MKMVTLDLYHDQLDSLVLQVLKDDLEIIEDESTQIHLKHVIAYYSVPGQYEDGKYDAT